MIYEGTTEIKKERINMSILEIETPSENEINIQGWFSYILEMHYHHLKRGECESMCRYNRQLVSMMKINDNYQTTFKDDDNSISQVAFGVDSLLKEIFVITIKERVYINCPFVSL